MNAVPSLLVVLSTDDFWSQLNPSSQSDARFINSANLEVIDRTANKRFRIKTSVHAGTYNITIFDESKLDGERPALDTPDYIFANKMTPQLDKARLFHLAALSDFNSKGY